MPRKARSGEVGKGAKKLDKDIEKQEDFLSELRDFEEKLRRAANLHLEPDLNDGVVLNIAPLWELVPWKEAKAYWEELMEGKYEWSSIGKQLRAEGAGEMSVVTEHLVNLIAKQVEDYQLVVWYDPEQFYTSVAEGLELPKTKVVRYDGSFFKLRNEIDPLMNDLQPPRLLVYVPLDQAKTEHALVELEAAGVVMQPGQQPPNRNTRLAIVARNALKPILGEEIAAEVEKQVEAGKLSLADVNALARRAKTSPLACWPWCSVVANPQEVALTFLGNEKLDVEIEKKSATDELLGLLQQAV